MKRQIDYSRLLSALKNVELIAPQLSPDKALKEIKALDIRGFEPLMRECRDFQENVERATEDCKSAVESPIYIGVVGHYSHGKSSLLNSLLFPPKSGEVLPTGEGVVTSLCTLIQFSNQSDQHEFYDVAQDGAERYLPSDEYRARVSGRGGNAGSSSHFKIRLKVDELSDSLFRDFAEKQIEMLDTPGLGGPYWKDEQALISWIKEFVMIVVCIKASEINEITADTVNPFLRQTTKPIVPVVTFWDQWQDSASFKGIHDETKARAEAKRRIGQFFPTLAQFSDQTIFTSAKSCMDAKPVPETVLRYFTEEWNVDNVRRNLANHVRTQGDILRKNKDKESALDSQRREQVRSLAEKLCADSMRYANSLREKINAAMPKGEQDELIQLMKDEMDKEIERETDRMTNQIDRLLSRGVPLIDSAKDWGLQTAKLKQDTELQYLTLKRESANRILTILDRFKQSRIDTAVKDAGLKEADRKRLDQEIRRHIEEFTRMMRDSSQPPKIVEIPAIALNAAKNMTQALIKGFKQLLISNLPLAIGLILVAPILMAASWVLKWFPDLQKVVPFLICIWAVGVVGVFWSQFQYAIKQSLYQAREKMLAENNRDQIAKRILQDFESSITGLVLKIADNLQTRLAPLDEKTRNVMEILIQDLERLDDSVREVRQLI